MLVPVILCGGSGTRLWPQSRRAYPKQFHALHDPDHSLLQETIIRAGQLSTQPPILVTNEEHRFVVAEQCQQLGITARILLEPTSRNTSAAIGLAALEAGDDSILFVMPSDHVIKNLEQLKHALNNATNAASAGYICTFGIKPTHPETGYGYIRAGEDIEVDGIQKVAQFTEKPSLENAESFIKTGEYHWNGGMFCLRADVFLSEWSRFDANSVEHLRQAFAQRSIDQDFIRVGTEAFEAITSESIDYAVMEKTDLATMVVLDAAWSDIGAWDAVWQLQERDEQGNALRGDVLTIDAQNNLVYADKLTIAAVGVQDLVIVESDDALLITNRQEAQKVKNIVSLLDAKGSAKHQLHRKVFRPWGAYDSIDQGERFQVKRITVKPGGILSLQMHHHRAEHWIVVRGTAKVTRGEESFLLSENQSTYIPLGIVHRLENPGVVPLELIEVQSGSYLGEDDIVRYEDTYGRQ